MKKLQKYGLAGALIAGFLCVTPWLFVGLGAIGFGWFVGYLELILILILVVSLAVVAYTYLKT